VRAKGWNKFSFKDGGYVSYRTGEINLIYFHFLGLENSGLVGWLDGMIMRRSIGGVEQFVRIETFSGSRVL
jgi:hypothetical protein